MKLFVAVCGLAAVARADAPRFDPYAYPHGRPAAIKPIYVGLDATHVAPELLAAHGAPALAAPLAREIR
ncbi:MAG: hypothetical protein ABI678_10260 [Kofleriaceae bacterium]